MCFFFKQKTAYEMRISDWSSDVCSSDLPKDYKASEDLEDRLVLPLLNEAVAALHDGVVEDADLLDAGVIFGTGFAPFRGGPIQYIRETGVDAVLRSEERRVGKECVSTGSSRWSTSL